MMKVVSLLTEPATVTVAEGVVLETMIEPLMISSHAIFAKE